MEITQALQRAVARRPDATATIYGARRRTFTQIGDRFDIVSQNYDRYLERVTECLAPKRALAVFAAKAWVDQSIASYSITAITRPG